MKTTVTNNGNRSIQLPRLTATVYTIIISFIIFAVSLAQSQLKPSVEFFKEEISMTVNKSEFTISGTYYFRNNTDNDKPMPIVFPFYIDDSTYYPHKIKASVIEGDHERALEYQENRERGNVRIAIPMLPKETTVWQLEYTQRIDRPQAIYILKSTQAWGKPLEEALYIIDIPDDIDVDYIWADVDSVADKGNREILWIHKTEYMPFGDMTIKWKER